MTDHPCKGLSQASIEAFELIASGQRLPPANNQIFKRLESLGLIARISDKLLHDRLGTYSIPQYEVPIGVHIQWCEWCSEQPDIK